MASSRGINIIANINNYASKIMPRVPRSRGDGEKCSGAGVSTNPDINTTAVQTNGKIIDFAHISHILEGAIDVLGNDNTKLASLENLLKTVLEKVAQKTRSRQNSKKRSSSTPPLAVPKTLIPPLTKKDLLSAGLMHVGFDHSRQNNVKDATNIERFKAFYGLEPTTLVPVFTDVKDKFPEATFHHLLITMNWLSVLLIHHTLADHDAVKMVPFPLGPSSNGLFAM